MDSEVTGRLVSRELLKRVECAFFQNPLLRTTYHVGSLTHEPLLTVLNKNQGPQGAG